MISDRPEVEMQPGSMSWSSLTATELLMVFGIEVRPARRESVHGTWRAPDLPAGLCWLRAAAGSQGISIVLDYWNAVIPAAAGYSGPDGPILGAVAMTARTAESEGCTWRAHGRLMACGPIIGQRTLAGGLSYGFAHRPKVAAGRLTRTASPADQAGSG